MEAEKDASGGLSLAELEHALAGEEISLEDRAELELVVSGRDQIQLPDEFMKEQADTGVASKGGSAELDPANEELPEVRVATGDDSDIRNSIGKMKLPQKIKAAMFGNATARVLLIRDSNRLVQQFVLKNPRIQVREIEDFARNPNLSEQVLRLISNNSAWTKSYLVKLHLSMNPKTPSDLAVKWVKFLNQTDIRKLAKSRNIPQVVITTARRRLEDMQKK